MKIFVDDELVFELNDIHLKVLANEIPEEMLRNDIKRRIEWVIMHKYLRCFDRLKHEWDQKLPQLGVKSVPTDAQEYASLVFAQPTYKDCSNSNDVRPKYIDNQSDMKG